MLNRVMLIGRLGQDPELRHLANGDEVCNFSMATSEKWTDRNGEKQERTEWHRITVFGKLAGVCSKYLKRGKMTYVEGKLQTRQWEDKEGAKRSTTEVTALNVIFLGDNEGSGKKGEERPERSKQENTEEQDMPF